MLHCGLSHLLIQPLLDGLHGQGLLGPFSELAGCQFDGLTRGLVLGNAQFDDLGGFEVASIGVVNLIDFDHTPGVIYPFDRIEQGSWIVVLIEFEGVGAVTVHDLGKFQINGLKVDHCVVIRLQQVQSNFDLFDGIVSS